jgi:hypothetical protein
MSKRAYDQLNVHTPVRCHKCNWFIYAYKYKGHWANCKGERIEADVIPDDKLPESLRKYLNRKREFEP